jgi:succinate dehydrogenase / fumarate reductase cytochrome b subunit
MMGVTGLLLCGFLLSHLAGNLLLFVGPDAFNKYSHTLISNPLIYLAEVILGLLFLSHIVMAIRLTMENKAARPEAYHTRKTSGKGATFASSSMPITGMIALVFLVLHIIGLKYGTHYDTTINGVEMRDIYKTTVEYFVNPLHVIGYLIAVISLGVHVSHGFWSAFQSLGFNHPKYMPKIKRFSVCYGLLVAVGFSSFPIYCYIIGGR